MIANGEARIRIIDNDNVLDFGAEDVLRYHGPLFPAGAIHGFKAMQRALPLLGDGMPERCRITVQTSNGGTGARDAIELVTRAVTGGRYTVDKALGAPFASDPQRSRYVFAFGHRGQSVSVVVRPGLVHEEFIALSSKLGSLTEAEQIRFMRLVSEMADRLRAMPADEVYELVA